MERLARMAAVAAVLLFFAGRAAAQPGYVPSQENLAAREAFAEERFGVFIHWGIYSMLGDGEWVMNNKSLNYLEYQRLAAGFDPSKFDADAWVRAIKDAGAKYITITSRHHDGFSMWNSKASGYNVAKATPFRRDVLAELAKACRRHGIKLHFYYSHLDWGRTDFWPRGRTGGALGRPDGQDGDWEHYLQFMNDQLTELLTRYGPIGAIWFDGVWDWPHDRDAMPERWNLYEQYALIHRLQPSCLVGNNHHLLPFPGEDIQIFERDIPGYNEYGMSGQEISRLPLETCQTMNGSWGYNINDRNYKSADELVRYLVRTAAKGANLLLNIGPRPDGTIPDEALERFRAMGEWMRRYGESIYGTQAGAVPTADWGVTTQRGNTLYVHVLKQENRVFLPVSETVVESAAHLPSGAPVAFTPVGDGILLEVPCDGNVDELVAVRLLVPAAGLKLSREAQSFQFLYENMSLADRETYAPEYWAENVRKTLEVRDRMGWDIPEREFRHFVLPLRVNNEDLDDFRTLYADTLCARVRGMSLAEAALEINHWCHEQATYQPSDARTSAPTATMARGLGRCGEESVLTVAALRAAGIPARQVYTPRWAHTDDNHAWVEAYVDGKWHFMGACEPAPVLDMAWFNAPVSRALLLHTKAFGDYDGPEEVISRTAAYTEINVTDNYVPVRESRVRVVDTDGRPVEGADVEFKIYNYAEFYTVSRVKSDRSGEASLRTGCGDLLAWASKGDRFGVAKTGEGTVTLVLDRRFGERFALDLDIVPPAENPLPAAATAEQNAENDRRLAAEDALRESRGRGNLATREILRAHPGAEPKIRAILNSLSEKDRGDVTLAVLEDALAHCGAEFRPYVDGPRVENEALLPYFGVIGRGLRLRSPAEAAAWVTEHIRLDETGNPQQLRIPPAAVWAGRAADRLSRGIFFVALCRTFGFAARIDPVTGRTQYRENGVWVNEYFGEPGERVLPQGTLRVRYTPVRYLDDPETERHFTLSRVEDGTAHLLSYMGTVSRLFPLQADEGYYLLTSGTRMADGSVLAHLEFFPVEAGKETEVELVMRTALGGVSVIGAMDAEQRFLPEKETAEVSLLSRTGRGYFLVAALGGKDEPTSHAVRQLEAVRDYLNAWGRPVVLTGNARPKGLQNAVFGTDTDGKVAKMLAEGCHSDASTLPVVALCDSFGRIVYFSQGYNTSLGEDLKRVIDEL